jgi:hypothetical protein
MRHIPTPKDHWMVRIARPVRRDHLVTQQIYIPHYQSPAGEVIGALLLHSPFGGWTVVVVAADFDGKDGRTFGKSHIRQGADIPGNVRAEGLAMRQHHSKPDIIREGIPTTYALLMLGEPPIYFASCPSWLPPCRCHVDDLPVDQLGLAFYFV